MGPQLAELMRQFEQQAQAAAQPAPPPPPPPKPPAPAKIAAPAQAPPQRPVAVERRPRSGGLLALSDRSSLMRAIVAAEVLGKPLALRDE